jgi:hypothetical protein
LTSSPTAYSSLVTLFSTKMCFPLLAPPHPPISTLSLSPVPPPPRSRPPAFPQAQMPSLVPLPAPRAAQTPRLASLSVPRTAPTPTLAPLPAPCAASTPPLTSLPAPRVSLSTLPAPRATPLTTPVPRVAPSTPLAPYAALSMSAACFADLAVVYHRYGRATPSAPTKRALSTSATRFVNPALVYHRRERATPLAPDDPPTRIEPPVYHPVAIHHDPRHVHPMVTRRAAGVLRLVVLLILTANAPLDASPVPSSIRAALADTHWRPRYGGVRGPVGQPNLGPGAASTRNQCGH